jgi:excisionase family DNA binding protein
MSKSDAFITITKAAERLSVSDDLIRRAIRDGELKALRLGHRTVRISMVALAAYVTAMASKASTSAIAQVAKAKRRPKN